MKSIVEIRKTARAGPSKTSHYGIFVNGVRMPGDFMSKRKATDQAERLYGPVRHAA